MTDQGEFLAEGRPRGVQLLRAENLHRPDRAIRRAVALHEDTGERTSREGCRRFQEQLNPLDVSGLNQGIPITAAASPMRSMGTTSAPRPPVKSESRTMYATRRTPVSTDRMIRDHFCHGAIQSLPVPARRP